jgi:opacity protein-like surface antigen
MGGVQLGQLIFLITAKAPGRGDIIPCVFAPSLIPGIFMAMSAFHQRLLASCLCFLLPCLAFTQEPVVAVQVNAGRASENFNWSIAGNMQGQNPNILSELKWRKLQGPVFEGKMTVRIRERFFVKGGLTFMDIRKGTATDTDYGSDNRTNPTYHKQLISNEGNTREHSISAGYTFFPGQPSRAEVSIGYLQGRQELLLFDEAHLPQATYDATWKGMVLDGEMNYPLGGRFGIYLHPRLGFMSYRATADWKRVQAFAHPVSFIHEANAFSLEAGAGLRFSITKNLMLHLEGRQGMWKALKGTDRLFLNDGQQVLSRFNGAKREVAMLVLGAKVMPGKWKKS